MENAGERGLLVLTLVNLHYCKFENISVSACCVIVMDYRHIESL